MEKRGPGRSNRGAALPRGSLVEMPRHIPRLEQKNLVDMIKKLLLVITRMMTFCKEMIYEIIMIGKYFGQNKFHP